MQERLTRSLKSGRTRGRRVLSIQKTPKTRGTTPPSGLSTAGFSRPPGKDLGDPYLAVCEELHTLLTRKRNYYGCPQKSPLENARGVAEQGITPWIYQVARIGEKLRRLNGLAGAIDMRGAIRETLLDIGGHAAVAVALLDNEVTV